MQGCGGLQVIAQDPGHRIFIGILRELFSDRCAIFVFQHPATGDETGIPGTDCLWHHYAEAIPVENIV